MSTITPKNLVAAGLADQETAETVAPALAAACERFEINTGPRIAGFLAQCAHESVKFKATSENLNYGAHALLLTFPKYFDATRAAAYARQPEKIANRVYANRMDNGPEESGDGWKYRGRGFIQLTGKRNYTAFDAAVKADGAIVAEPSVVAEPENAALSAAWFWKSHGLNEIADTQDVVRMTKVINGGTIGLDERKRLYLQALAVF